MLGTRRAPRGMEPRGAQTQKTSRAFAREVR